MENKYEEWNKPLKANIDDAIIELAEKRRESENLSTDFLTLYLFELTGLIYSARQKWGSSVEFHVTTRKKSIESLERKKERFNKAYEEGRRENKVIKDEIASTLVIDRVKNDDSIALYNSAEVSNKYHQRNLDIDLLASLINFVNDQLDYEGFYSEYESEEPIKKSIEQLKTSFNSEFKERILKLDPNYNFEKIKPLQLEQKLLNILIERRNEIYKEHSTGLKFYMNFEKIVDSYNEAIDLLKIQNSYGMSDTERNDQEDYYKYLIILLNRVKHLEYEECEESYDTVYQELNRHIDRYVQQLLSPSKQFSDNVTLENLQLLEMWCKKFNAQMSDKLQQSMIKELMEDAFINVGIGSLKSNVEYIDGKPNVQQRKKPNGYVSDHYTVDVTLKSDDGRTIIVPVELKGTSHYRNLVSHQGNAADGSSRQEEEIRMEKKRPMHLLPISKEGAKKYIGEKEKNGSIDRLRNMSYIIDKFGSIEKIKNDPELLKKWQMTISRYIPSYIISTYDDETRTVKHEVYSILHNAKQYFGETNIRKQKAAVTDAMRVIEEEELLPNHDSSFNISMEEYHKCLREGLLQPLINNAVDFAYKQNEEEIIKDEQDKQDEIDK